MAFYSSSSSSTHLLVSILIAVGITACAASDDLDKSDKTRNASTVEQDQPRDQPASPSKTVPPPPPECPAVMQPPASFCPGGTLIEKRNAAGCVSGFDCQQHECPAVMQPTADSCLGGTWIKRKNAQNCDTFECVYCPAVMAPPASECAGTWVERKNEIGCTTGFDCKP
jgi:hypothetical protein